MKFLLHKVYHLYKVSGRSSLNTSGLWYVTFTSGCQSNCIRELIKITPPPKKIKGIRPTEFLLVYKTTCQEKDNEMQADAGKKFSSLQSS